MDISGDPADGKALFIIAYNKKSSQKRPALSGRFIFEDHIRCSAAKNFLHRSREKLFISKMSRVSKLLHLPVPDSLSSVPGLPGSHRGLHQQHVMSLSDDTSQPSELGATPTLAIPTPPQVKIDDGGEGSAERFGLVPRPSPPNELTASVLHRVFTPPQLSSRESSNSSHNIELSSLVPSFDGSGGLPTTLPNPSLPPPLPLGMAMLDQTSVRLTTPIPETDHHRVGVGGVQRLSLSPTPEPHFPDEEGLTASGGLLERQRMSSSERSREQSFERSLEMSMEKEERNRDSEREEKETVCPLGLELIAENGKLREERSGDQVMETEVMNRTSVDGGGVDGAVCEPSKEDSGNSCAVSTQEQGELVSRDLTGQQACPISKEQVGPVGELALDDSNEVSDQVNEVVEAMQHNGEHLPSGLAGGLGPNGMPVHARANKPHDADLSQNFNSTTPEQDQGPNGRQCESAGCSVANGTKSEPQLPQCPLPTGTCDSESLTKERSKSETQFSTSITANSNGVEISRKLSGSDGHVAGSYDRRTEHSSVGDGDEYLNGEYFENRKTSEDDLEMFL